MVYIRLPNNSSIAGSVVRTDSPSFAVSSAFFYIIFADICPYVQPRAILPRNSLLSTPPTLRSKLFILGIKHD